MVAQSHFFTVDLWPRLPPPNASFTATKRLVYRRQTTRMSLLKPNIIFV